ncbi:MAG: putative leader peptide [Streptosporangiaceae bacterium]
MRTGIAAAPGRLPPVVGTLSLARAGRQGHRSTSVREPVSTGSAVPCDPRYVSAADPLLVARRHVDLLRVRSAICRHGR